MSDKRVIYMQEYEKKVGLCESEIGYALKVWGKCWVEGVRGGSVYRQAKR
mgnify:CR=1 FL=1